GSTNLYSSFNQFVANDTLTGYHIDDTKTSVKQIETDAEVLSVTYYDTNGVEQGASYDDLPAGIYVRHTRYMNGAVQTCKILKR
ncbi:MAG: hypothetical protein IKW61_04775, partial [Bacteroidaceae bacterium]|nr:hypothetical protein [Bacteroidaceae bacterium]